MSSNQTVVVTGGAGFVGTAVVQTLLSTGYTVRVTVRKLGAPQYAHLEKLGEALPGQIELFEADLLHPGSFDKPIEGATFVFHTASPVEFGYGSEEEDQKRIVDPAINGTTNIIKAAAKHKSVKRVVITSSIAAINPSNANIPKGDVYTAETWNDFDTLSSSPYYYSKTCAEKAAWKLAKELGVEMVTIHPSLVVGPLSSTRSGLSADLTKTLLEGGKFEDMVDNRNIDVRDVAEAHVLAAELPHAKGRYILSHAATTNFKEVSDAMQAAFPDWPIAAAKSTTPQKCFDISKVESELGLNLRPISKAFVDAARTNIQLKRVTKK